MYRPEDATAQIDASDYVGPVPYAIADWRRAINDLYAKVRATDDPETAWNLWVQCRSDLFRHHPMSPIAPQNRAHFDAIAVYDYNPDLRFHVDLSPAESKPLAFDLGDDGSMGARQIAETAGLSGRLGAELAVFWIGGYGGGLFIPFKDATSSGETFGGGRYLVDAIKGSDLGLSKDGRLILDFNFAYNPSCALNAAYVCPLSPAQNTLPTPVRAGERLPTAQNAR